MEKRFSVTGLLAEFLGSMFLVVAAVSSRIFFVVRMESTGYIAIFANAITVAFALIVLIEIFGPISGAHFNPVVTLIVLLERKLTAFNAFLFIFVQILGGISGTILSHLMFFDDLGSLIAVSDNARNGSVFWGEIVGTFILILTILLLVKQNSTKISIMVGLLVGSMIMATSSTMFANPQVTIARIFTDTASGIRPIDAAIFIIMQFIGALSAYVVYKFVFSKKPLKK